MATRIICRAIDCIFWDNKLCTSEEIIYDPEEGCLTYEVIDDLVELDELDEDGEWEDEELVLDDEDLEDEDDDEIEWDDDDDELLLDDEDDLDLDNDNWRL